MHLVSSRTSLKAPHFEGTPNQSGIQFNCKVPLHAVEFCKEHLLYPFKHKARDLKIRSGYCTSQRKVNKSVTAASIVIRKAQSQFS